MTFVAEEILDTHYQSCKLTSSAAGQLLIYFFGPRSGFFIKRFQKSMYGSVTLGYLIQMVINQLDTRHMFQIKI